MPGINLAIKLFFFFLHTMYQFRLGTNMYLRRKINMGTKDSFQFKAGEKIKTLAQANPGHIVKPLINAGTVIEVGGPPLNLMDFDIGSGTALLHLYRSTIDYEKMDHCVGRLTSRGSYDEFMRCYKIMAKLLDKFHYRFTPEKRRVIASETGVLTGPSAFVKVSSDGRTCYPWLLLSASYPTLARIVTDGRNYARVEDQMEDLRLLQKYAASSREFCVKRLCLLYYDTRYIDEVASDYEDHPSHEVSVGENKIYLSSRHSQEEKNLSLGGRFGDTLYRLKPNVEPRTPVLTEFAEETESIGKEILSRVLKGCRGIVLATLYLFKP